MKDYHELFLNKGFYSVYRNSAAVLDTRNTFSFTISVTSAILHFTVCKEAHHCCCCCIISVVVKN